VVDDWNADLERRALVRALRQRLESLGRAGLDGIPAPPRRAVSNDQPIRHGEPAMRQFEAVAEQPAPRSVLSDEQHARSRLPQPVSPPGALPAAQPAFSLTPRDRSAGASPMPAVASLFGAADFEIAPVPACDRPAMLDALAADVAVCRKCPHLADTRTQTVFGTGSPATRLMFVGEAPGADEDRLGQPFVGRAGQLLNDMITKGMGLSRDQVYIANILKCRPPENRAPTVEESANCLGYLEQQIAIIRPEFLCLLGRVAVQALLNTTLSMSKLRGKWHRYRGIPTMVTYHPAYLLRKPEFKRETWEDLQMLMREMGLKVPHRSGRDSGES